MSNVINLNTVRKKKARAEKEAHASENRTKFGRTKNQKALEDSNLQKNDKTLDQHELED